MRTRERVLEAAARMNYRPNRFARGLVTGRSNIMGLIVSDVRNPYFAEVARGAEDAAYAAGCDIVLCNSDLDSRRQMHYIDSLTERRVEGIIMNSVTALTREQQARIENSGIPIVLLNRPKGKTPFSTVCADNEQGGRLAASYLVQLGHRRLAHLTGPRHHDNLSQRAKGFLQTVREHPGTVAPTVVHGVHTVQGGHAMACKLFQEMNGITAVFAANDAVAFGVIKAAIHLRVRIPRDVSLIGFDNVDFASIVHPPLTTIHQSKYDIGASAVDILLRLVSAKDRSPEHRLVGVELVARQSVRDLTP